jgi:hypothetical protein
MTDDDINNSSSSNQDYEQAVPHGKGDGIKEKSVMPAPAPPPALPTALNSAPSLLRGSPVAAYNEPVEAPSPAMSPHTEEQPTSDVDVVQQQEELPPAGPPAQQPQLRIQQPNSSPSLLRGRTNGAALPTSWTATHQKAMDNIRNKVSEETISEYGGSTSSDDDRLPHPTPPEPRVRKEKDDDFVDRHDVSFLAISDPALLYFKDGDNYNGSCFELYNDASSAWDGLLSVTSCFTNQILQSTSSLPTITTKSWFPAMRLLLNKNENQNVSNTTNHTPPTTAVAAIQLLALITLIRYTISTCRGKHEQQQQQQQQQSRCHRPDCKKSV